MPSTHILMQQCVSGYNELHSWGINKTWEQQLILDSDLSLPSTVDGSMIYKYVKGLTIPDGYTLTTSNRCKGLGLFVYGDLIVNGTISMTARGASAAGQNIAIDYNNADILHGVSNYSSYDYWIGSTGGVGGTSVSAYSASNGISSVGKVGAVGTNYSSGGGGSGGAIGSWGGTATSGAGGRGTSYSGGSGGGGCAASEGSRTAGTGSSTGGAGGSGAAYQVTTTSMRRVGMGGTGNPYGSIAVSVGQNSYTPTYYTGTGGLLIIIVKGNVTIGSTGVISSNGSRGCSVTGSIAGAAGGGSGGGSITLLYTGTYTNNGTVQANGGTAGSASVYSGAGGVGSIRVSQIIL